MDPKIVKLMDKLDVTNIAQFNRKAKVDAVRELSTCWTKSTLEDYTWRLIRELKDEPRVSKAKVTEYRKIWKEQGGLPKSRKKPTGKPRGRPPGVKNKC